MQWSDIPLKPNSKTLRWFAGMCLFFFGTLAIWQGLFRGNTELALLLTAVALGVGLTGLVWPQAVRAVYVGWMIAVFPIGWTVSLLLLAILFYGVFTPIGVLFKVLGRDVLCRRSDLGRISYWAIKPAATDPLSYFRQF
jgi:hypothetical protein